ncbi:MAG: T9SS type A sorting domain-containing protein [Bacteroidetes bacterium]|nr:T9SS type A sorting domain-containing protein [Bacteroidota bacterium]
MNLTNILIIFKISASLFVSLVGIDLAVAQNWNGNSYKFSSADTVFTVGNLSTIDASGNLFLAGQSRCIATAANGQPCIRKISSTGVFQKQIYLGYSTSPFDDVIRDIKVYNNSLYVVMDGQYNFPPGDHDILVYKYDLNLNLKWSFTYNSVGDLEDRGVKIIRGNAGSLLVLGNSADSICVLKLDSASGSLLKRRNFRNSSLDDSNTGVDIRYLNNATYVAGTTDLGPFQGSTVLLKLDNNLNFVFTVIKHASFFGAIVQRDVVTTLQLDAAGNCFIAGHVFSKAAAPKARPFLLKYSSTGVFQYLKRYGYDNNECFDFFVESTGNLIMYTNKNRYLRISAATGLVTLGATVLSSINFQVADVAKGADDNLYVYGKMSYMQNFNGSPFEYKGVQVTGISTAGVTSVIYQENYQTPFRLDLTYTPKRISVRNSNQVYFSMDVDDLSLLPNEFFVKYGCRQFTPARLPFETAENNASSLIVYPNPAQSIINVTWPTIVAQGTLQIFDLQGKLVITKNIEDALQNEINIQNMHSGTYIIKMISSNIVTTDKFVKL